MSFIAKHFSFDRVPCEKYGLRIIDIDGNNNHSTPFASAGELKTDVVPSNGRNFLYGRTFEKPLEFTLIFGLDPLMLNMNEHLDRYEMDAIANWLTGSETYKWLEIEQPDLGMIRYHCVISELEPIELSWIPWAFTAKITCDSPYAYRFPERFHFSCTGVTNISLISRSTINRNYYPRLSIRLNGSRTISIVNESCDNAEFKLANMVKSSGITISVDNDKGIIAASDGSNLYRNFNFTWLPLKRGRNKIKVTGNCELDFNCEFPVNTGG